MVAKVTCNWKIVNLFEEISGLTDYHVAFSVKFLLAQVCNSDDSLLVRVNALEARSFVRRSLD